MTRRCSHCAQQNHNSRTCPERGVRLFGVRIQEQAGVGSSIEESMRKSVSMGNLSNYSGGGAEAGEEDRGTGGADGYLSDGLVHGSRDRKRGIPWTEEEHRLFLLGLQKLGKGDWRGISRTYVQSRTPTQVASHAQKYFIRQSNINKRKRRSSLFDLVTDLPPSASAPNLRTSASSDDIRTTGIPTGIPPLSPNPGVPSYGPPPSFFDPGRKASNFPLPSSSYPPVQFHFPNYPPPTNHPGTNHPGLATSFSTPSHFPTSIPFSPPNYISPGFAPGFSHPPLLARHATYPQFPLPSPLPPAQQMTSGLSRQTSGISRQASGISRQQQQMTSGISRQQQMAAAAAAATEIVRATSYERLHDLAGASTSDQRTEVTKPIAHKASPSHPPPQLPPLSDTDDRRKENDPPARTWSSGAPQSFPSAPFHGYSQMPWLGMGPFGYSMMQNGAGGAGLGNHVAGLSNHGAGLGNQETGLGNQTASKVCRPTASHPSAPLDIPGCFGRGGTQSNGDGVSPSPLEPSPLSAKLLREGGPRHSAFQSKLAYKDAGLSNGESNSVIRVV